MPSQRHKLKENLNDSKNTRMEISNLGRTMNYRPDELAHLSRYDLAVDWILRTKKERGEPLDLVEVGCGECHTIAIFSSAYVIRKSDIIKSYTGYDIDPAVKPIEEKSFMKLVNGKIRIQDLTVLPVLEHETNSIDMAWSFETIEHMKPKFVEPWICEVKRILKPGARFIVSTPNHDGSNKKLPKDHIYEWGFQELKQLLAKHFKLNAIVGTFLQTRRLKETMDGNLIYRYGQHWRRNILAMDHPEISNNCIWHLSKREVNMVSDECPPAHILNPI